MSEREDAASASMGTEGVRPIEATATDAACSRCGDYAPLRPIFGKDMCGACVERLPRAVRDVPTATGLVRGAVALVSQTPSYAWVAVLVAESTSAVLAHVLAGMPLAFEGVAALALSLCGSLPLLVAFDRRLRGESDDAKSALTHSIAAYSTALTTTIYASIIMGLAALALLVPAVLFWLRYSLVLPIVLHERKGGGFALKRSTDYMRGVMWPYLGAATILLAPPILALLTVVVGYEIFQPYDVADVGPAAFLPFEVTFSVLLTVASSALAALMYANRRLHRDTLPRPSTPA